ncbi:hypothetical protein [uncultured Draconibacterium sp.]|uniref:endo-beta-N-acetylglucosaminidase n=1 Tax=uncultured Draconibacterium sp. TaxID=1573823 RepID=UPI0029C078BC|nr:hypothetical protein [uncultured Draconibacterium sp.]
MKMFFVGLLLLIGLSRGFTQNTNQPYTSVWFPNDLLVWKPSKDPDATFNKSGVSLQLRPDKEMYKVNSNARIGQGKINSLSTFGETSFNPSQGSLNINYNAFNYWQYVDVMVFWGGSATEGIILAPNHGIIDAAHRNGVRILGTVFFPPNHHGGKLEWVKDFLIKSDEKFLIADKLIEVANYYGFDGWFINQETYGGDRDLAKNMIEFIKYYQENSDLELEWYDAMIEDGRVIWQDELNSKNDGYFQFNDKILANHMFIDFGWSRNKLLKTREYAKSVGRSEYDLYAAVNFQDVGYYNKEDIESIFPEGEDHVMSMGLYVPSWVYNSANSIHDFYNKANLFWVGENKDPSTTENASVWNGIAHYIPAKTSITEIPFSTNFCVGQGCEFYKEGTVVSPKSWESRGWNNMSLQDVLPTWRWLIESEGKRLEAQIDFTDAYYGGNCISVSGQLTADNLLRIYKTKVNIELGTKLELALKYRKTGNTNARIALKFADNMNEYVLRPIPNISDGNWNVLSFNLSRYVDRQLVEIAIKFDDASLLDYELKLGRISIANKELGEVLPVSKIKLLRQVKTSGNKYSLRLTWNKSKSEVRYYNIYKRKIDGTLIYLGGTSNNSFFIPEVEREIDELDFEVAIEAVSEIFTHSELSVEKFDWVR